MSEPLRALRLLSFCTVLLVAACARPQIGPPPTITRADIEVVLTKAAQAAQSKLGEEYCVDPDLMLRSSVVWNSSNDPEGWVYVPPPDSSRYRRVARPSSKQLPKAALDAFGQHRVSKTCKHTLIFEQPEFMETVRLDEHKLEAIITFSDFCKMCGGGHTVRLRKTNGIWQIDEQGVVETWLG